MIGRLTSEERPTEQLGASFSERRSTATRESAVVRDSSIEVTKSSPSVPVEDQFVATGCLKGEECYETPKAVHRLFEEILLTTTSPDATALIYGGELSN